MELADKVDERQVSGFPEKFDPKFGDTSYLATERGRSRLKGYLWTFGYMIFCGVLLIIGGGTFFIYESIVINRLPEYDTNRQGIQRSARLQDNFLVKDKAQYSKELQTVAFVFIGVGAVLFVVGLPLASQFYRRYKRSKEVERSPILDPQEHEKKRKIVKEFPTKSSSTTQPKTGAGNQKNRQGPNEDKPALIWPESPTGFAKGGRNKRRKSKVAWTYRSPKKISEGFRFAAHRHPSMNPINLDGSNFPDRHFGAESSPSTSDDEADDHILTRKMTSSKGGIRNMISKLFGAKAKTHDERSVAPEQIHTDRIPTPTNLPEQMAEKPETTQSRSRGSVHSLGKSFPRRHSGYEELDDSSAGGENDLGLSTGGLYNLG